MNDLILREAKLELARREFFFYCNIKASDFYKKDRQYLVDFCNELQNFLESDTEVLIINAPPRHGKSRTLGLFCEWLLGENKDIKIMTGTYNETLSTTFSKGVRNSIQEIKADKDKVVYSDIFPDVKIRYGDGAMNLWSLENGYNNYLATSPTGTSTGFGANLTIIDDLIKSYLEANNADVLEKHWEWFTNTMLSRLEEGGKIIIAATRWHSQDLSGRYLEHCKNNNINYKHIVYKAKDNKGKMLCDEILSIKSFNDKRKAMGEDAFNANYQQEPVDIKGKLYAGFKTYTELPKDEKGNILGIVKNYTDTADEGKDYLASIDYLEYNQEAYVINVYYTKASMEITEEETAKMFYDDEVVEATIESNNGGKGFARAVIRILKDNFKTNKTVVNWFHQSLNKKARIITNASWVMQHIYMPVNWRDKWPEFYKDITTYQRDGKNAHDDGPDAITGISESIIKPKNKIEARRKPIGL